MSYLEIKACFLNDKPFEYILYCGLYFDRCVCILKFKDNYHIVVFQKNLLAIDFKKIISFENFGNEYLPEAQIVGNNYHILLFNSEGDLFELSEKVKNGSVIYKFHQLDSFRKLNFRKVFGIAEYQKGFVCLGLHQNGEKMLKVFETNTLPDFVDITFSDLNTTKSNNYYLNTIEDIKGSQSLIISDKLSRRTYLCSNETNVFMTHYSNLQLISVISIKSENCYLFCFENGKLVIHAFSNHGSHQVLFLTKRVVSIVKCLCNDRCLLWSDGIDLHHTEINFGVGIKKMTHFKVENNIKGIMYLAKVEGILLACTVNSISYIISKNQSTGKELVRRPDEILNQIYNESLKMNDFQNNLKTALEYLNFKETIQSNYAGMELNLEGNYLIIKNKSKMTFTKEFWKIKFKICVQGLEWVKIVDLETDFVKEMIIKIQNPYANDGIAKVYLLKDFEWEILCFFIGMVGKEVGLKKKNNLKEKLNEIKLQKNPKIEKE